MGMVALVLLIALSNVAWCTGAEQRAAAGVQHATGGAGRAAWCAAEGVAGEAAAGWRGRRAGVVVCECDGGVAAWSPQIESSLQPDGSVMLFALGILALTALLFGLAPLHGIVEGGSGDR